MVENLIDQKGKMSLNLWVTQGLKQILRRVVSSSWQNMSFLSTPPQRTMIHLEDNVSVEIKESSWEVPAQCWSKEQSLKLDALKRVTWRASLSLHHPLSPKAAQLSVKRDLLPQGEVTEWECAALLAPQNASRDTRFFLTLSRMLRCVVQLAGGRGGEEQLGGQQIGLLRAFKWLYPSKHFRDSMRREGTRDRKLIRGIWWTK